MFAWTTDLIIGMPIVLLIIIFISYIIRKTLKNKSERVRNYPLKIVAMVILILEIVKQVENVVTDFDPWAIPLHFCSLFVFFCPLAQFGTKKSKSFMKPVAFICAITMCLAFYTAPQWIIGKNAFINSMIGKNADFLFEEYKDGYYQGYTENYLRVYLKDYDGKHDIVKVKLIEPYKDGVKAVCKEN